MKIELLDQLQCNGVISNTDRHSNHETFETPNWDGTHILINSDHEDWITD